MMIDPHLGTSQEAHEAERRRILAARGWEHDRQRVHALRELLSESIQHIFLWSYAQLRNRDRAIQNTRDTLVWMSRNIGEIPEQHPVEGWVFEHIALETPAQIAIRRSELGPEPALVLSDQPNEQYLQSYPASQKLRAAFLEYTAMPRDAALIARSGWAMAEADLRHFVEGHFSEEGAGQDVSSPPLRHRLNLRRISIRRWLQIAILVGAAAWIWLLRAENADLKQQLTASQETAPPPSPPEVGTIEGYKVMHTAQAWIIGWDVVTGADSYSVSIMTEKMSSLLFRDNLTKARCLIPAGSLPEIKPDGSFLYKIDAFHRGKLVASSGYVAHPPI